MDRRHFLTGLGAASIGLSGAGIAAPASSRLIQGAGEAVRLFDAGHPIQSCKIIGIGGAGCNFVMAARSGGLLDNAEWIPEFICIDVDGERLKQVDAANRATPLKYPTKSVPLGTCGAGGWVNGTRVAAMRNRDMLKSLLDGAEAVCLVAGLGGGTGSGVTPIMARLARDAGARTVAAVITPFEHEGRRNRTAANALGYLQHDTDRVMVFSNEEWSLKHDGDALLSDVFSALDRRIAASIRRWMVAIG